MLGATRSSVVSTIQRGIIRAARRPLGASSAQSTLFRYKSTAPLPEDDPPRLSTEDSEVITFPTKDGEGKPVLLNAKEHAVGYLSKILNARVYDAARETELQLAKNLSAVS